ncbi:MAG: AMP-binding protein, partial [Ruminococcaceae bacterium]|nr:AMP-binding protein [Oscillospiraceae bacterium]
MIASKFLTKTKFDSYEDFLRNYYLQYPDNFNFATDVVDAYAQKEPERRALVWCDDNGGERIFTFKGICDISRRTAAYIKKLGIKKGDRVMLLLKRRWEYWPTVVALHRIGAIAIPASFQLKAKDISYRVNAANVKLIIAADDDFIINQVEIARPDCPCLEKTALIRKRRDGWVEFSRGVENTKEEFVVDETLKFDDHMLIYFTSGTDGYPKMVVHSYTYPLGHITTAGYWQCVVDGGLHFTGVDSGWA